MTSTRLDATVTHVPPTKPTVVGLYGLSGCGKTFLLAQLKAELEEEQFAFFEGSAVLSSLVPDALDGFKQLNDLEKESIRIRAIGQIAEDCFNTGRVGIVTGHFIFWDANNDPVTAKPVWTVGDAEIYTHILYLDIPAELVAQRRQNDSARTRPTVAVEHLNSWQTAEKKRLRDVCLANGILFSIIPPTKVSDLLRDIEQHNEQYNLSRAEDQLDTTLRNLSGSNSDTIFVFDGDKTMISEDTGALFVDLMHKPCPGTITVDPLKAVFKSSMGYSYTAFRQVSLIYEAMDDQAFNDYSQQVAASVKIHPEIVSMLERARGKGVAAVVITCGLRTIWESILDRAGLSETVKVVGSGRVANGFVVTGEVKGALVSRLKDTHHKYVCVFGDSVLDLPMLKEADRAIVVVGDEKKRSAQMDKALSSAVDDKSLYACQVLLPPTASPRLDTVRLPCVDITSSHFVDSIVPPVAFAAENVAKLLMTPMRDATVNGPSLRKAHVDVGRYLATALLSERIGLEPYTILHVQGLNTTGYRLRDEEKTSVVALMRGGEPMAQGVNEVMPLAMFIHAKVPSEVERAHVEGQKNIILVDSVVNSGKSIVDFVSRIRELNRNVRILVVAGVVQAKALSGTMLAQILTADNNIDFVALRRSNNKFTGRGTTDTGNRLFNTTKLE